MADVTRTVVLTGARAGQTCVLGTHFRRFRFIDGRLVLRGDGARVAALMEWLRLNYQAYELGSKELEAALGKRDLSTSRERDKSDSVPSGDQPGGAGPAAVPSEPGLGDGEAEAGSAEAPVGDDGPELPEGAGHQDARVRQILAGLNGLDPSNRSHWTYEGLPKVAVVAELASVQDLTRREIDKIAPGFKRRGS